VRRERGKWRREDALHHPSGAAPDVDQARVVPDRSDEPKRCKVLKVLKMLKVLNVRGTQEGEVFTTVPG